MSNQRMGHKAIETFIEFRRFGHSKSGLTKIWHVINTMQDDQLCGTIRWHGAWRKYVFDDSNEPGFYDWDFLRYVADFIETKTLEHRHQYERIKGV